MTAFDFDHGQVYLQISPWAPDGVQLFHKIPAYLIFWAIFTGLILSLLLITCCLSRSLNCSKEKGGEEKEENLDSYVIYSVKTKRANI